MESLHEQRCYNHAGREAVARCPECGRFYCRECITEHEDRVICAQCLAALTARQAGRPPWGANLFRLGALAASAVVVWLIFYAIGLGLAGIPDAFHEGAYGRAHGEADRAEATSPETG